MNKPVIGRYLGRLLGLISIAMVPSLFIALIKGEWRALLAFLATALVQGVVAYLMNKIPVKDPKIYSREGLVIVALSWVLISLFGALPMWLSGAIPSYVDALFETVSGFTTTGASILSDVEALPLSVLFWRSFSHFLGGMGVLVLVLALAPSEKGSGMSLHIMRAESTGPVVGKLSPKISFTARILYIMYIALTLIEFIFLLCGGMGFMDALLTAFGTAGTGGFGVRNDSLASFSPYCQTVVAVFMALFGINFSMFYLLLIGDIKSVWKNAELRLYLGAIFCSTTLITLVTRGFFGSWGETLRHAFFQVSSIITTSGFSTYNYELWPEVTHFVLILLMFIGGCAGSTAGGIKVARVLILWKSAKADIKRTIHPRSVSVETLGGEMLDRATIRSCTTFFVVYFFLLMLSTFLLSFEGHGFTTNFTATVACLNNVGPGFEKVGPACNFAFFTPFSKIVLILDMLFGRLEIFPLLLTLLPSTWRKGR